MPAMGSPEVRPWGSFTVLDESGRHKVKRLEVTPGLRLSYQRHRRRSEHWFFVSGEGLVTINGEARPVHAGDALDVPLGSAHRVANTGAAPLVFIEVQHGESFDEDDIERLEDDFGRAG